MSIKAHFPIRADMSMNSRAHWAVKARKVKEQRQIAAWILHNKTRPEPPYLIHLTRVSPRLMDDDNSMTALKAVRDAIATWLGIDDRHLNFRYYQRKGPWGVDMEIEADGNEPDSSSVAGPDSVHRDGAVGGGGEREQ